MAHGAGIVVAGGCFLGVVEWDKLVVSGTGRGMVAGKGGGSMDEIVGVVESRVFEVVGMGYMGKGNDLVVGSSVVVSKVR